MNVITRNIPNAITCLNVLAGTMAIILGSRGSEAAWGMKAYEWAYIFIGIAAVADFADGFAARALHAYSNLGKELDSLCDMVSFGVAPAIIVFQLVAEADVSPWTAWGSLLIAVSGAVRLARFNIDTRQATSFIGLPIPANAIFWIGYTALLTSGVDFLGSWYVFLPVLVVECWLMNSGLGMFSLKFKSWGLKGNVSRWLLIVAAPVFVFTLGVGGLMWLIVFYVGMSLARPGGKA